MRARELSDGRLAVLVGLEELMRLSLAVPATAEDRVSEVLARAVWAAARFPADAAFSYEVDAVGQDAVRFVFDGDW